VQNNELNPPDRPEQIPGVFYPVGRIARLLLDLKLSLGRAEGQPLSYEDWERIAGRPSNTIASWCAGGAAHQLQVLLASLERLAIEERHRLIETACRDYPTLAHPKLAHDFVAGSRLATLLQQTSGLTFIQGGPEHMRTFVLTAMGNSAAPLDLSRASVSGVDTHRPDDFVPVIGVVYLDNPLRSGDIERRFTQLWPAIRTKRARWILLNDIWHRVPNLRPEIIAAASESHVVVADSLSLKPGDRATGMHVTTHLVTVSPARERPEWIRLDIQAI
jgi:hypothetical protein